MQTEEIADVALERIGSFRTRESLASLQTTNSVDAGWYSQRNTTLDANALRWRRTRLAAEAIPK
jgi:hypothetical protein